MIYAVLAAWAVQRGIEMLVSRRNARWLASHGAHFVRADGFTAILLVHLLSFALPVVESLAWGVAYGPWTVLGAVLFLAGQALRYHAILTLGKRWNTRVWVLPAPLVQKGLYGRIRHPNYLGVSLELAGLPIAFGLWRTAIAITVLNGLALMRRIRIEEAALAEAA